METPEVVQRRFDRFDSVAFKDATCCGEVVLNAVDYAQFRKFGRDRLELCTDTEYLKRGYMGSITAPDDPGRRRNVWVNQEVPVGLFRVNGELHSFDLSAAE